MRVIFVFLLLCLCVNDATADDSIFLIKERVISDAEQLEKALSGRTGNIEELLSGAGLAEYYYQRCKDLPTSHPDENAQKLLCACTAAQMQLKMTPASIKMLFKDTPQGAKTRTKFNNEIYAPCMAEPAGALAFKACINNGFITERLYHAGAVCHCIADELEAFTRKNAPVMFVHWRNKDKPYSINTILGSKQFTDKSERSMTYCIRKHEYGW